MEKSQAALFVPVALGVGIGIYFGLPVEPPNWAAPLASACGAFLLFFVARHAAAFHLPVLALTLISFGFLCADLRALSVEAPILPEQRGARLVEGILLEIEVGEEVRRLIIRPESIRSVRPEDTPAKIRVSWRGEAFAARPGDRVRFRAFLSPPPQPVAPGSYDFARQLYFQQIGAIGYATQAPERVAQHAERGLGPVVERARLAIGERIRLAIGQERSAIAAICVALVTGKREGISETSQAALRDAGLAHLLAISGLHMGLVAGLLFFSVRFLLASNAHIALFYPIKKWAVVFALMGATAYLLLSGAAWSTQRAFIMASVFFVAILLDRRAISLRNVAIAATILLLLRPEALFQAGFQMSFAAVTVLIAAYEWYERRGIFTREELASGAARPGLLRKSAAYIGGLAGTSVLAGFATAPFALFHFNRYAAYGLAGNLLAMPVMVFITMPVAIIGVLLMPVGLDWIAWKVMGLSIEYILSVSSWVSSWRGAVAQMADIGFASFLLLVFGGLVLTLLRTPLRLLGAAFFIVSFGFALAEKPADIIIGGEGRNLALKLAAPGEREKLVPYSLETERFALRDWLATAGQSDNLVGLADIRDLAKGAAISGAPVASCTPSMCRVRLASGQRLSISDTQASLRAACQNTELLIALYRIQAGAVSACPAMVIDQTLLEAQGAVKIRMRKNKQPQIITNRSWRGVRPWSLPPEI